MLAPNFDLPGTNILDPSILPAFNDPVTCKSLVVA